MHLRDGLGCSYHHNATGQCHIICVWSTTVLGERHALPQDFVSRNSKNTISKIVIAISHPVNGALTPINGAFGSG
jgi:hypothetical protein